MALVSEFVEGNSSWEGTAMVPEFTIVLLAHFENLNLFMDASL